MITIIDWERCLLYSRLECSMGAGGLLCYTRSLFQRVKQRSNSSTDKQDPLKVRVDPNKVRIAFFRGRI